MASIAAGLVAFAAWTLFSFYAHYFARSALLSVQDLGTQDDWFNVATVTCAQMLIGGVILRVMSSLAGKFRWTTHHHNNNMSKKTDAVLKPDDGGEPSMATLAVSHLVASLCTNASMVFANAGSAFTVKAAEPITSAVLTSMLLGQKMETSCIISLPMVVTGAIGFVWQPQMGFTSMLGLGIAFVSNILFGIRNINIKQFLSQSEEMEHQFRLLSTMSFLSAAISGCVVLVNLIVDPGLFHNILQCLGLATVSALFHSSYTTISTCVVLKFTSVIGHATMNLLKRILVAAGFFIIGQRMVTSSNIMFCVVMVAGLLVYAFPKCFNAVGSRSNNPSLCLTLVTATMVLLAAMTTGIWSDSLNSSTLDGQHSYTYKNLNAHEKSFLRTNLHRHRNMTDFLSSRLTATTDVIAEASRIHDQIFPKVVDRRFKVAVLVNVFTWANKGDQLIMIGQRHLLSRLGVDLIYYCYYPGYDCDFSKVPRTKDLVVFIQGAGYIGHPAHLYVVNKTVSAFPNNRVVVFPISTCHPTPPCVEIRKFASIFASHKDVHIMLRDRYSYMLAVNFFKANQNYLVPDSAFAIGPIRLNILPVYDIIWLKRNDWESTGKEMPTIPSDISHVITDWQDDWMNQKSPDFMEDHQLRAMAGMMFLSRARVVITDRLHAHIMCVLLDKPHVIVNSNTRKQDHYFSTWEKSLSNVYIVDTYHQALEKAIILLHRK